MASQDTDGVAGAAGLWTGAGTLWTHGATATGSRGTPLVRYLKAVDG